MKEDKDIYCTCPDQFGMEVYYVEAGKMLTYKKQHYRCMTCNKVVPSKKFKLPGTDKK